MKSILSKFLNLLLNDFAKNQPKSTYEKFYEEKTIGGKLFYRTKPDGKWNQCVIGLNGYF